MCKLKLIFWSLQKVGGKSSDPWHTKIFNSSTAGVPVMCLIKSTVLPNQKFHSFDITLPRGCCVNKHSMVLSTQDVSRNSEPNSTLGAPGILSIISCTMIPTKWQISIKWLFMPHEKLIIYCLRFAFIPKINNFPA